MKVNLARASEDDMIGGFEPKGKGPRKYVKKEFDERTSNEMNHIEHNKELRKLRRERELNKDIDNE